LSRKKSYENLKFGPEDSFVVGVIGRVTFTKGVKLINSILDLITLNKQSNHYKFIFFGDISEDVKNTNWFLNLKSDCRVEFAGFVDDTDEIYSKVHCIMHFSEQEPLGRIFLESVDYSTPFIGLKAGGIGELGKLLNLEDFLAQNTDDKGLQIFKILTLVRENYEEAISRVKSARASLIKNFSVEQYVKNIDAILVE
jgi:glycosyltransferase involved in cell wall biosynthesis